MDRVIVADYAIGDLQGCYVPFLRLLETINFDPLGDRLWLVGDLVNRGPDSLAILRFLYQCPQRPRITLGNHDLHLLQQLFCPSAVKYADDTLDEVCNAPDGMALGHWLRTFPFIEYDAHLNVVMTHAGISPLWTLEETQALAQELSLALNGENYVEVLTYLQHKTPVKWSATLTGLERLRVIAYYLTRMRYCDAEGALSLGYKGAVSDAPAGLYPWYVVPNRVSIAADIVFGHWSALMGQCPNPHIYPIDTGCLWGGPLTALRLQDKQFFSVSCSV